MSTTTISSSSDPLTWKQADIDVHVATRGGEFAGFVEFDGSAHVTHDHRGTELGAFDSLERVDAPQPRPSTFPFALPRALRRRPRRARA